MTVIFEILSNSFYIRDMRPWLRFSMILFAYGMALLHTAVPHHHEVPDAGRVTITSTGCHLTHATGGILQRVFSTDLGYGHLEVFKKSSDTNIQFSGVSLVLTSIILPVVNVPVCTRLSSWLLRGFINKLHQRLLLFSETQFRAPPVRF